MVHQTLALDRHSKELATPVLMTVDSVYRDIVELATSNVLDLERRLFAYMRRQGAPASTHGRPPVQEYRLRLKRP